MSKHKLELIIRKQTLLRVTKDGNLWMPRSPTSWRDGTHGEKIWRHKTDRVEETEKGNTKIEREREWDRHNHYLLTQLHYFFPRFEDFRINPKLQNRIIARKQSSDPMFIQRIDITDCCLLNVTPIVLITAKLADGSLG